MQLPSLGTKSGSTLFSTAPFVTRITIQDLYVFIPENSAGYILDWFQLNLVHLRISKTRSSKFGDYRPPVKTFPARISVNRNLNKFDFLITLVHEMAHHEVWTEFFGLVPGFGIHQRKRRPRPHGKEWKTHYRRLMEPLMKESIFPAEVLQQLFSHFNNLRSSSKSNEHLIFALKKYDVPDDAVFIESLEYDAVFTLPAGRKFRKREKLRKRYRCVCLDNGRIYLFSPMARVMPVPT
jgi:SprT protein